MIKLILAGLFLLLLAGQPVYAAHPLITDDTGTQGAGKVQIEINGEYSFDRQLEAGMSQKTHGANLGATVTVGVHDRVDIAIGVPYQWVWTYQSGTQTGRENGVGDVSLDIKWRFFEKDGWSLAVKPGVTLPSGDDERGFGNGRMTYKFFLIGTKEIAPFAFHVNLGYIRNESSGDDERNIWHASAAAEFEVIKNLKVVANVGAERNPELNTNTPPVFALGGLIYQFSDNFSVDGGVKIGLTRPETDLTFLLGMTLKF
jgi:hypothetical protein